MGRAVLKTATDNGMIRAAMRAPYLERDEEHQLALRWRDSKDQDALNKITTAHMRLVISMAAKFRHYGLSSADLIQEGHVGLLEAAARFEPDREVRFSTYATWWIRASIQDYILRNWSIVRGGTSSAQKALFFNLRRLRARINRGVEQTDQATMYTEIATALRVTVEDVARMDSRLSSPDSSLNAPVMDDGNATTERQDFLVDDRPLPDEIATELIDGERRTSWLKAALKTLNARELSIIRERRLAEESATLEHLGERLGISKERVRQIESRALSKLRIALEQSNPVMAQIEARGI
ncbi:MAG: RNA polymerase factor sigma-32 [Rhizobiaceae bacterium]|nr:RNA polymerase factor sigma-32 [Rhizobiaceae bacterium]